LADFQFDLRHARAPKSRWSGLEPWTSPPRSTVNLDKPVSCPGYRETSATEAHARLAPRHSAGGTGQADSPHFQRAHRAAALGDLDVYIYTILNRRCQDRLPWFCRIAAIPGLRHRTRRAVEECLRCSVAAVRGGIAEHASRPEVGFSGFRGERSARERKKEALTNDETRCQAVSWFDAAGLPGGASRSPLHGARLQRALDAAGLPGGVSRSPLHGAPLQRKRTKGSGVIRLKTPDASQGSLLPGGRRCGPRENDRRRRAECGG
jgi:hypothetical protein